MSHQIFNDFINRNSFNKDLSFSQTKDFFLKSFNSVLYAYSKKSDYCTAVQITAYQSTLDISESKSFPNY